MNTKMHGRAISSIKLASGPFIHINDGSLRTLQLSATYHGDRDEFWVLHLESDGAESARYNARCLESIHWLEACVRPFGTEE